MTINHLMLKVNSATFSAMREFYNTALKPLGYVELMEAGDSFAAFGSDHPFLFVKAVEEQPSPIHFAFNAPDEKSVDEFWKIATEAGGKDNGAPGIRGGMPGKPYGAFVIDLDGNNIEVAYVDKSKK